MEASQNGKEEFEKTGRPRSESETESDAGSHAKQETTKKRRKSSTDESGSTLQERWDEMFERLRRYKEDKGNCNVPNRYPDDPQLGFWVSTQRRQYRVLTSGGSTSSALTVQRAQKLMNLGFEWSAKDPRMVPWETRYNQLKDFVAKNGHAQVPIGWEENVPLSNWVSKQRQEYKLLQKGKASRLTEDRIEKLKCIGFVWEAKRGAPRQVIISGDRQSSTSTRGSPDQQLQRSESATSQSPDAAPARLAAKEPERDYVAATPPTSQTPLRGMRPASPRSSSSAPPPYASAMVPTARLPPGVHPNSYHPPEAAYHGVFQPQREYYQSYYPSAFSPSYPHATASTPYRGREPYTPSGPPPPLQPPATWPRTGRVLTPLYPLEHHPIPGYLVATPPAGHDSERRPPAVPHASLPAAPEAQDGPRRRSSSVSEARHEHAPPPHAGPPPHHGPPPPHPYYHHHHDGRGGYY